MGVVGGGGLDGGGVSAVMASHYRGGEAKNRSAVLSLSLSLSPSPSLSLSLSPSPSLSKVLNFGWERKLREKGCLVVAEASPSLSQIGREEERRPKPNFSSLEGR